MLIQTEVARSCAASFLKLIDTDGRVLAAYPDGSVVSIANRNSRSLHFDNNQLASEMRLNRAKNDAREMCSVEVNAASRQNQ